MTNRWFHLYSNHLAGRVHCPHSRWKTRRWALPDPERREKRLGMFQLWNIWTNPSQDRRQTHGTVCCLNWTPTCLDSFPGPQHWRLMKWLIPLFWRYRGAKGCGGPAEMGRCCFIEERISRVVRSMLLVFCSLLWVLTHSCHAAKKYCKRKGNRQKIGFADVYNLCRFPWDGHVRDVNSAIPFAIWVLILLINPSPPVCISSYLCTHVDRRLMAAGLSRTWLKVFLCSTLRCHLLQVVRQTFQLKTEDHSNPKQNDWAGWITCWPHLRAEDWRCQVLERKKEWICSDIWGSREGRELSSFNSLSLCWFGWSLRLKRSKFFLLKKVVFSVFFRASFVDPWEQNSISQMKFQSLVLAHVLIHAKIALILQKLISKFLSSLK